jgi:cysteine-rich repeat protein
MRIHHLTCLAVFAAASLAACGTEDPQTSAECGNSSVEAEEACDDGNFVGGDGCTVLCTVEAGYTCPEGGLCTPVCGDTRILAPETCDDGNVEAGDGCSPTCAIEPEESETRCNDGLDNDLDESVDCLDLDCAGVDPCEAIAEICDDALDNDGDEDVDCDDLDCSTSTACVDPNAEICTDGVDNDGDTDIDCEDTDCVCAPPSCGNGVVEDGEECDDGEGNSDVLSDACRTTCVPASCGDGAVDSDEECDDGELNGDTAACSQTCEANLLSGCTAASGLEFFDNAEFVGLQQFRLEGRLTNSSGNSFAPPSDCGGSGPDTLISVVAPLTGPVAIRVVPSLTTVPVTISQIDSCTGTPTTTQCVRATRTDYLIANIVEGEQYFFFVDTASPGGGQYALDVFALNGSLGDSAPCEPGDELTPCLSGLECYDLGDGPECNPARPDLLGLDEVCRTDGSDARCADGLECASGRCRAIAGQACVAPLVPEALQGLRAGESAELTLTPAPFYEYVPATCGASENVTALSVETAGDGVLVLNVTAPEGSPAPLVSAREVCTIRASEFACERAARGNSTRAEIRANAGESIVVFVAGEGDLTLTASFIPLVAAGGSCDPSREADRCVDGLACSPAGRCEAPLEGTCGAPADLVESGEGDIEGRGLVISATLPIATDDIASSCTSSTGIEYVYRYVPNGLGQVDISWVTRVPGTSILVRSDCAAGEDLACDDVDTSTGEIAVKRVQVETDPIYIIVDSDSSVPLEDAGVITVNYTPLGLLGQPCDLAVGCRDAFDCAVPEGATEFICVYRPILPGQVCVQGEAPCVNTYACVEGLDGISRCELAE